MGSRKQEYRYTLSRRTLAIGAAAREADRRNHTEVPWEYKEWTAVGNYVVFPRHIEHLSGEAISAIVDLMMLCESRGYMLGDRATLPSLTQSQMGGEPSAS